MTALQPALATLSAKKIQYYEIPAHTLELSDALNDVLSKTWKEKRGIEVFSFNINSLSIPDDQRLKLTEWEENAMTTNPNTAAAQIAQVGFPYYAVGIPFFILNVAIVGYCQSIERMKAAVSFVFLRGAGLLIPVFLVLPLWLGTEGIWLSMPAAELSTLLIIICWYVGETKELF